MTNQPKRFTMPCPGCSEPVYLDPLNGWRNDASGYTCGNPRGHSYAVSEKLGRAFHEAGEQILRENGLIKTVPLPAWEDINDLQRLMVFSGVTAVLLEASR